MSAVKVSSSRFNSLLANRRRTVSDVAAAVTTDVDIQELAQRDLVVTLSDVEALARFFGRPWPYLLIDADEPAAAVERDHRSWTASRTELSDDLLEALSAAENQLELIIDLFPDEVMHLPDWNTTGKTAEEVGAALRAYLGVTFVAQRGLRDEFSALRTWIAAMDAKGVYVSQRKFNDDSVRAFSLFRDAHALVVVDTGDSGYARCFSVLHEAVHLTMRSAGICDLNDTSGVERWCNAVAAAALMPQELLAAAEVAALRGRPEVADEALRSMSQDLGVSQQALLIRCRDLHLIAQEVYEELEARRAIRRARDRTASGGNYYVNAINRVGRRFTRQILGALGAAMIAPQDAAAALDVKEHQLRSLRDRL